MMNAPARFGRLAQLYRWMEYFSFGPYLKRCRELHVVGIGGRKRALVYGDGDGRFVAELARRVPMLRITAVDASPEMLRQTARRLSSEAQVRLVQANALESNVASFPEAPFDLIVTHFFLDCFEEAELTLLLSRVNAAVEENATWVVSEFAIPHRNPARLIGILIVRGLYLAFGVLTGLKTRRLPDHGQVMRKAGWVLEDRRELLLGLLASENWRRVS
jgi:ubiquinone/menaquinone biosynthesis C-methylase UbiE